VETLTWALSDLGSQISAILETIPAKLKRSVPTLTYTDLEIVRKEIIKTQNAAARVQLSLPNES
jgi:phage terminase Nu1 subunit (DNA packaging protein)